MAEAIKPFSFAFIDPSHPQLFGLRSWWPFWEGAGLTVQDIIGGDVGTFAVLAAEQPVWAPGRDGFAVSFDGVNDFITSPFNNVAVDFTCTAWFLSRGVAAGYDRIVDKNYASGFWMGRNASNANQWGGGVQNSVPPHGIFVTLPDGQWHHLAITRRGTTQTVYGNGGQVSATAEGSAEPFDAHAFGFGQSHTFNNPLNGMISDVRFYDRALTLSEVQDVMNNPWAPVVSDLGGEIWFDLLSSVHRRQQRTSMALDLSLAI